MQVYIIAFSSVSFSSRGRYDYLRLLWYYCMPIVLTPNVLFHISCLFYCNCIIHYSIILQNLRLSLRRFRSIRYTTFFNVSLCASVRARDRCSLSLAVFLFHSIFVAIIHSTLIILFTHLFMIQYTYDIPMILPKKQIL